MCILILKVVVAGFLSCCALIVEYVIPGDQKYEEIVEEYEKEVLIQEEVPEPSVTNAADIAPAQGKPWCITLILLITVYIFCAFTLQEKLWKPHAFIYLPMSLTSAGLSSSLIRFIGSVTNMSLLTIGGGYYYYYSHNKMLERKW
jgi:hypothetical protein